MRSRPSSRNSVKAALISLLALTALTLSSCSSSTTPTYRDAEDIPEAVRTICREEYQIKVKTILAGETLWVYLPVEDIFLKSEKPVRYNERFAIETTEVDLKFRILKVKYDIKPLPADTIKEQSAEYNKEALEKVMNVWKVLRRVIFSADHSQRGMPQFFVIVTADVKNGMEMFELFHITDLKKVTYDFISWGEYQHRSVQNTRVSPEIIGDTEGLHIRYRNVTWGEFISAQIHHRIRLKFQKPEVEKNVNVNKEIIKIISHTVRTYGFKEFDLVQLDNLASGRRAVTGRRVILESPLN